MNSTKLVTIVDYGLGNIFSVCRAFESQGAKTLVTSDPQQILSADRLVLPGVGAFEDGMKGLREVDLIDPIREYTRKERPFLGICLGMQMMLDRGLEFGTHEGLALIPGDVTKIPEQSTSGERLKVPHIGWNTLQPTLSGYPWEKSVLKKTTPGTAVYFVHSFSAHPVNPAHSLATVNYGGHAIVAAIGSGSSFGCQFHPERSGAMGLQIIESFLEL